MGRISGLGRIGVMADSDYIIYADESGDHSLTKIDSHYPIFVVAFAIVEKATYGTAIQHLLALKFQHFGHDMVVLHEREIRKRIGEFAFLRDGNRGPGFYGDVSAFVQNAPFRIIAAVIKKQALVAQYVYPENPYDIALTFCLERAYNFLVDVGQQARRTFLVVESRGPKEDKDLELAFRRTCAQQNYMGAHLPFDIRFSHKQCNSTGMQLADLVARPIGQEVLAPGSQKQIYPIIKSKFRRSPSGLINGWGLKVFP